MYLIPFLFFEDEEENGYRKDGYIVCNKTDYGYRYGYVNADGKEIIKTKYK